MTEDILKYADVFSAGMRLEVELPLADEKQFRDDAKVVFAHQDLLVLQLTRELFPESASLETGAEIHLRTGKKSKGYRCRAILLSRDGRSRFKIRLIGEVLPLNDREFFRIDVFIPILYHPSSGTGRSASREMPQKISAREYPTETGQAETGATEKRPLPVAANLSGAGVRINIPERFEVDELLDLTLYLPFGDGSTMTLVGQVVQVSELTSTGAPHPLFSTALHFVSLDDAQRETLIRFIQRLQLNQIRRQPEPAKPQVVPVVAEEAQPLVSKETAQKILWAILFTLVAAGIILSLDYYRRHKTKGEIERTFEEQVQKIIEQR